MYEVVPRATYPKLVTVEMDVVGGRHLSLMLGVAWSSYDRQLMFESFKVYEYWSRWGSGPSNVKFVCEPLQ